MSAATNAVENRTKVAARIVAGSVGFTSYSCDSTRRPNAQTQGSASAVPPAIITSASRSTSQMLERRVAPNAHRRPSSRVHWVTTKDITRAACMRRRFKDLLTCSSSVRKYTTGSAGSAPWTMFRMDREADTGSFSDLQGIPSAVKVLGLFRQKVPACYADSGGVAPADCDGK